VSYIVCGFKYYLTTRRSLTNTECSCRWRRRTGCQHNVEPRLDETCSSLSRPDLCISRRSHIQTPDRCLSNHAPCITTETTQSLSLP